MDGIPSVKPSEVEPFIQVLEHIRDSGLLERFGFDLDINARMTDIQNQVRQVAMRWYGLKLQELQSAPGVNRALPLLLMTDEIEKAAKLLDKRFPEPLLGSVTSAFYGTGWIAENALDQAPGPRVTGGGGADSSARWRGAGIAETTL